MAPQARPAARSELTDVVSGLPHRPERLLVDIWNWCNFECIHCCQSSGPREAQHSWSLEQFHDLVAEAVDLDVQKITLIGGEPSLHPGLFSFLEIAAATGIRVGMVSNGWCIDDAFAHRLAAAGCAEVALSLYGHVPDVHDAVTRKPGSLDQLRSAAAALRRSGIPLRVIVVVTRLSVGLMREPEFWSHVGDLAPVAVRIVNVQAVGRALEFRDLLEVRPDEYIQTLETLRTWTFPYRVTMSRFFYDGKEGTAPRCADQLGRSPAVMSGGRVLPCCTLSPERGPWTADDLREQVARGACRHLPETMSGWEIRCPLVEIEMPRGIALSVPAAT